ncbi:hypothetical protein ACTVZO_39265 [Streptomyces sp. IBSNAI002]|uniref:hypothetical protein n=1 Tax=Streptomyces sp. IBSNAI002 TaxID=3457500 RepID=UPI003FCF3261
MRFKVSWHFDFPKNPNVAPGIVADLESPTWVREGRPLVLIGGSGTDPYRHRYRATESERRGKTHR